MDKISNAIYYKSIFKEKVRPKICLLRNKSNHYWVCRKVGAGELIYGVVF